MLLTKCQRCHLINSIIIGPTLKKALQFHLMLHTTFHWCSFRLSFTLTSINNSTRQVAASDCLFLHTTIHTYILIITGELEKPSKSPARPILAWWTCTFLVEKPMVTAKFQFTQFSLP